MDVYKLTVSGKVINEIIIYRVVYKTEKIYINQITAQANTPRVKKY
jgi:hypothetical protein